MQSTITPKNSKRNSNRKKEKIKFNTKNELRWELYSKSPIRFHGALTDTHKQITKIYTFLQCLQC